MNNPIKSKFQLAYSYITSALNRGDFDNELFLPSIQRLSKHSGVSVFTMWKVIDALRKEGVLCGKKTNRLQITRSVAVQKASDLCSNLPAKSHFSKAIHIQNQIRTDILDGRFAAQTMLPSTKELMRLYGVTRVTMGKILRALVKSQILCYKEKKYLPVSILEKPDSFLKVILVGYGTTISTAMTWGYWHKEFLKMLESAFAKVRISLEIICFTITDNHPSFFNGRTGQPATLENDKTVIGYIYEISGDESISDNVLSRITKWEKPIALFDELGVWPSMSFCNNNSNVRIFRNTLSDIPAEHVARFSLELGHRKAIFISPHHDLEYSKRRLRGLELIFSSVCGGSLTAITSGKNTSDDQPEKTATIKCIELQTIYENWKKGLSYAYTSVLDKHFELLASVFGEGRDREKLEILCNKAISLTEPTLWIMVNDSSAVYAFDFLKLNNRKIPEDISIISFDNIPDAYPLDLTSYNFNYDLLINSILQFIVYPRQDTKHNSIIEIPGTLTKRTSTGSPRVSISAE